MISFHIYCLVIFLIFCIGFRVNINLSSDIPKKNKNIIIFITIIFFLFSSDLFYLNNMFLSSSIFLIILYYIRKFLLTSKIINLIRASIFALSMFFMFPHYANILNFFYIPLLILSFGLIINYKNFYKIYFKTKYLLYLLFIILLFVFF